MSDKNQDALLSMAEKFAASNPDWKPDALTDAEKKSGILSSFSLQSEGKTVAYLHVRADGNVGFYQAGHDSISDADLNARVQQDFKKIGLDFALHGDGTGAGGFHLAEPSLAAFSSPLSPSSPSLHFKEQEVAQLMAKELAPSGVTVAQQGDTLTFGHEVSQHGGVHNGAAVPTSPRMESATATLVPDGAGGYTLKWEGEAPKHIAEAVGKSFGEGLSAEHLAQVQQKHAAPEVAPEMRAQQVDALQTHINGFNAAKEIKANPNKYAGILRSGLQAEGVPENVGNALKVLGHYEMDNARDTGQLDPDKINAIKPADALKLQEAAATVENFNKQARAAHKATLLTTDTPTGGHGGSGNTQVSASMEGGTAAERMAMAEGGAAQHVHKARIPAGFAANLAFGAGAALIAGTASAAEAPEGERMDAGMQAAKNTLIEQAVPGATETDSCKQFGASMGNVGAVVGGLIAGGAAGAGTLGTAALLAAPVGAVMGEYAVGGLSEGACHLAREAMKGLQVEDKAQMAYKPERGDDYVPKPDNLAGATKVAAVSASRG